MKKQVLLTGGLGYVGGRVARHLAESTPYFLKLGARRETATPVWLKDGSIARLDVLEEASLAEACKGVDYIVHFAALNEIDSARDPEQALVVNGLGSLRLLRAAIQAGVKRFIYFSTAHVYGAPLAGVLTEETLPRPQHPYAITHRTAEDFVLAAHDKQEITGLVVRLSNGFGAPERPEVNRWTLLANDLCRQAVVERKLVLKSAGLQARDFITLEDVARAVRHLIGLPEEACGNGLFNLGGENAMRIIDVAERIASRCEAVLGYRPAIQRPDPAPGETAPGLDYRMDKLKATGFALQSNVDQEIDSTLKLCRQAFSTGS